MTYASNKQNHLYLYTGITLILVCLLFPQVTLAQFVNLVNIPTVGGAASPDALSNYINALYFVSISIAAMLAVIKIVIAGVKYMLSEIVTDKGEAKKDIRGALFGLIIVAAAVLILSVINNDLTNWNLTRTYVDGGGGGAGGVVAAPTVMDRINTPGTKVKNCGGGPTVANCSLNYRNRCESGEVLPDDKIGLPLEVYDAGLLKVYCVPTT